MADKGEKLDLGGNSADTECGEKFWDQHQVQMKLCNE